ncbi:hypothetical protein, partial [Pseudomonas frederiksbergensis]|uniref:hypothetical protein n=1 Tax=Pseudomonas frederiksbergensis TaxID=104087 RepID=UPI00197DB70C
RPRRQLMLIERIQKQITKQASSYDARRTQVKLSSCNRPANRISFFMPVICQNQLKNPTS